MKDFPHDENFQPFSLTVMPRWYRADDLDHNWLGREAFLNFVAHR